MRLATVGTFAALALLTSAAGAATITQWNFNGATGTSPSTGVGTLSGVGGATAVNSSASGSASGGSSDPAGAVATNYALTVSTFPADGTANETAGLQAQVSTVGYENITLTFDNRHSSSAPRHMAVYYTLDGTTYQRLAVGAGNASPGATPAGGNPASTAGQFGSNGTFAAFDGTVTGAGDDWFNGRSVNFSSISGANNNANFAVRLLASFDAGTTYAPSSVSAYATSGNWRFDQFTIGGTAVPEPTAIASIVAGLALARRRRGA